MGQRSIERGSRDYWTPSPSRINAVAEKTGAGGGRGGRTPEAEMAALGRAAQARAARSARLHHPVRPARLPDRGQVRQRAARGRTSPCSARPRRSRRTARRYPAGSFVVMTDAGVPAARDGHVRAAGSSRTSSPYPGAPPTPPYDNAGWTLAFQMGVQFDRVLEPVHRAVREGDGLEREAAGRRPCPAPGASSLSIARANDAFTAVNRLLAAGEAVGAERSATFVATADAGAAATTLAPLGSLASRRRRRRRCSDAAARAAHRSVGSVRRLDRVRLDALDPRAVRVPVHARLRAGARRRQPEREVRRADLRQRRDSARRPAAADAAAAAAARRSGSAVDSRRSTARSSAA